MGKDIALIVGVGEATGQLLCRLLAELLQVNPAASSLRFSVFSIDGATDEPKMRAMLPDKPTSCFIQPDDITREMVSVFDSAEFPLATGISGELSFAKR